VAAHRTDQLKRALAALKGLRTRLEKLEREPIAIVGMGCRFPGGADDPSSFQRLLHDGVDAVREAPPGRWDLDSYYDPDPESPGKTNVREGAFLDRIDLFEPQFFGIAPREAATMDPQQRLLLEVAWEAIEDAGRPPRALAADRTGIFVGLTNNDYSRLIFERSPAESLDAYVATGNGLSFLTGRLAYFLGVQGPNMVVATECSSSAVALHLACQSLRAGECRTALAGGVNVLVSPKVQVIMSRMKAVAPDGRSKTFDARADGFGRGEGCGVVVLRRLADALADRDRILALVRGSAFNHDGRSNGLTAPNGAAQQSVIRTALERAGVEGAEVGYVETHGTGTSLGDPIEVEALAAVLCAGRSPEHPLVISSVKTNIGHLEAAAGIAAVIKAVLVLRHEEIPPHLHLRRLNPLLADKMTSLVIPTEPMPWPRTGRRRLVGVSSFGMSGINAHLVLEEAPAEESAADAAEPALALLTLSAKEPAALRQLAERHERHLEAAPGTAMADVGFTSIAGRAHFGHRLAVVAGTPGGARAALSAWRQGKRPSACFESPGDVSDARPRVAFLFTGQGAQHAGMGRRLYAAEPVFRGALDKCDEILRGHLDEPLLAVLYPPGGQESPIDQTAYAQPALFALSYALTELWGSWGVKPDAVLGHSVGEYAAAWAAGALGLEDGLKLIAARGRLMQALPGEGAMAVAFADAERLSPALAAHRGAVSIAALNGPQNTVLSGARPALEAVLQELGAAGVKTRRLRVSQAFHSPLMEPMTAELERLAAGMSYGTPRLELVSNLTGQPCAKPPDAAYWRSHVRQPVLFAAGVAGLCERGCEVFVEIGPSSSLLSMARRLDAASERLYLPSLRQGHDEHRTLLGSLAALYVRGIDLDGAGFDPARRRRKVALPTYPFQRRRYWVEDARPAPAAAGRAVDPVLGERVQSALSGEVLFQSVLSLRRWPFLSDHRVYGLLVVPAAAQLAMALAAAERLAGGGSCEIAETVFTEALLLEEDEERPLQLAVAPPAGRQRAFHLFTQAAGGGEWTAHASGQILLDPLAAAPDRGPVALEPIRSRLEAASIADFRSRGRELGLELGPAFQGLTALRCGAGESLGEIEALATGDDWFHPVSLDACFQVLGAAFESSAGESDGLYVPFAVRRAVVHGRPGRRFWCHARAGLGAAGHDETRVGDVSVLDPAGRVIAEVEGLCLKRASRAAMTRTLDEGDWLYEVAWTPRAGDEETLGAEGLRPPGEIGTQLRREFDAFGGDRESERYAGFFQELEALSTAFALAAFAALGWEWRPGEPLSATDLAAKLGIVPRHRRLLGRMLEMLTEDGLLEPTGEGWTVVRPPAPADPAGRLATLRRRFAAHGVELSLVERCGAELPALLRGIGDPLQLLFADAAAGDLYRESPKSKLYNTLAARAVAAALEGWPAGRALRVLEIGAGTGGTTRSVLPQLPPSRTEYVFSDVSPSLLAKARQSFAAYPYLRTEVLDIEKPAESQGFAAHGFDLVVAANVLHATRDLEETLGRVRRLLAPQGMLVLLESTGRQRWADLTFGLLEGWWRFADFDRRPSYPLLSWRGWQDLLAAGGFHDAVAVGDGAGPDAVGQVVIVARGPGPEASAVSPSERVPDTAAAPRPGCWLLFTDRESVGEALAARLEERGEPCLRVSPGSVSPGSGCERLGSRRYRLDPDAPEAFRRLLDEVPESTPLLGVVHLWSLDAGREAGGDLAALRHDLRRGVGSVLHLVQALAGSGRRLPRLWLVTRGAQPVTGEVPGLSQSPLWGLAKVIDLEHPDFACTCVDLDPADGDAAARLWRELAAVQPETHVAFREGQRWVARLVRQAAQRRAEGWLQVPDSTHFRLEQGRRGMLEDLAFQPLPDPVPGPGEVAIQVRAAGLNFRDVLNALDMYPGEAGLLGLEASGTVTALGEGVEGLAVGDRVLAVAPGSFATAVVAKAQLVVRMPPGMSFEEAATLPVAFLTACDALCRTARLAAGQRLLIHAAAGGVGLAAVQLAQSVGAQVFATASPGKWAYLHGLGVEHVMSSRSPEGFAAEIRRRTGGKGVDVVLNSLSGEWIPLSLAALAAGGCFVEIGKRGIWDAERVAEQRRDVSYHVLALDERMIGEPRKVGDDLRRLAGRFARGELQPLRREVFAPQQLLRAFRHVQHANHVGKVVIAQPEVAAGRFRPRASYLITGGLGGLGLAVARWAVERGARHLVLVGRREPSAADRETIDALRAAGAEIAVRSADVTRRHELAQVLSEIGSSLPPLAGVIHSVGVLDDGVLTQQSWERFERVLAPKVEGAWNLHQLTRELALDFFVLFSSAASVVGSPGQGNHSAANAFLDALAHHRRAQGLPAQSVNWGAWSEIGAAAAKADAGRLRQHGAGWIPPRQGLRVFGRLLAEDRPQVMVLPADWRKFLAAFSGRREPAYFSQLRRELRRGPAAGSGGDQRSLLRELAAARPGERREILVRRLREQAGAVLGLEPGAVDPGQDLSRLGLDSLMAVELRNTIGNAVDRKLPATLLFDHPTIEAVVGFLVAEGLVPELDGEETPATGSAARDSLDDVSSAELRALLDSELAQLSGLSGGSE
jgi:acyl transferase domain-containing protein/NADPH:quinone reductase-like Zn-dependent oxidoreductase/acyl carrier protein